MARNVARRLQNIPTGVIYLLFAAALVAPYMHPMGLPLGINRETLDVFTFFDRLPSGAVVYMAFSHGNDSIAENLPQEEAVFRHLMRRGVRVVIHGMSQEGVMLAQAYIQPIARALGKVYGLDYVNLGYKPGGPVVLRKMTTDLWEAMMGVDYDNHPLATLPVMKKIRKLDRATFAAIIDFNAGGSPMAYRNYITDPLGIPLFLGSVAVNVTGQMPFYRSGQFRGILCGLRGAAEYEKLLGEPGRALAAMDSQSLGHAAIIALVVLGNLAYLGPVRRRRGTAGGTGRAGAGPSIVRRR